MPIGSPVRSLIPWCSTSHGATPRSASMIATMPTPQSTRPARQRSRRSATRSLGTWSDPTDGCARRPGGLGTRHTGGTATASARRSFVTSKRPAPSNVSPSTARRSGPSCEHDRHRRDALLAVQRASAAAARRGPRATKPDASPAAVAEHEPDVEHTVVERAPATTVRTPPGRSGRCRSSPARRACAGRRARGRAAPSAAARGPARRRGPATCPSRGCSALAGVDHCGVAAEAERVDERPHACRRRR